MEIGRSVKREIKRPLNMGSFVNEELYKIVWGSIWWEVSDTVYTLVINVWSINGSRRWN